MNSRLLQHDLDLYLRHYDNKYAIHSLPVILFLAILMLVGFVGNSLVCYVYLVKFKASSLRCYILALATFDLATCVVCIPVEIADIRYNYTFGQYTLCKMLRLLATFSVIASVTILLAIAVDRSVSTDDIRINGSRCTVTDDYSNTQYPLIYNGGQMILFMSCILSLSVLYGLIWRRVARQQKRMNNVTESDLTIERKVQHKATPTSIAKSLEDAHSPSAKGEPNLSLDKVDSNNSESTCIMPTLESFKNDNTCPLEATPTLGSKSNRRLSTFGRRKSFSTCTSSHCDKGPQKTTRMLFLITLVFVLSFLPHLGLMVTRAVNKNVFEDLHGVGFIAYNVFLRSYFINSVSNPILYSFCSVRFRQELTQLWESVAMTRNT
ncbi:uncharacterized protein LOC124146747 [Haliotis rufescens]|uniref:uncharacterized protein LOC124146747 n=1 Tax=Haliotis rufescens TaxID=6454 RepID=UPI001EB00815|nr:uncharacterized protein LOC124146747 [Haliotis rufescens]